MTTLPPHAQESNFTVYRLLDPRDNTIRYVGITINVFERFKQHLRCDGVNPSKDAWIQELQRAQLMPIMESIEQVEPLSSALERERHWIQSAQEQGAKLFNIVGISPGSSAKLVEAAREARRRASAVLIPTHVQPWDIADFPICKRNDRLVTVEYATNEEFEYWAFRQNLWDSLYWVEAVKSVEWFTYRCLLINYALDQGWSLELADGSIISLNAQDTPPGEGA